MKSRIEIEHDVEKMFPCNQGCALSNDMWKVGLHFVDCKANMRDKVVDYVVQTTVAALLFRDKHLGVVEAHDR